MALLATSLPPHLEQAQVPPGLTLAEDPKEPTSEAPWHEVLLLPLHLLLLLLLLLHSETTSRPAQPFSGLKTSERVLL